MKLKLTVQLIIFFILTTNIVCGQTKEVKFLIDTTIEIMRQHSVNSNAVNWNKVKQQAYKEAASDTNPYKLGPIIRGLYKAINDYHGTFYYKDSIFRWNYNEPVVSDSIKNEWKKGTGVKTSVFSK